MGMVKYAYFYIHQAFHDMIALRAFDVWKWLEYEIAVRHWGKI